MSLTITSLGVNSASGSSVTLTGLTYAAGDRVTVFGYHDGAAVATPVTDSLGNVFTARSTALTAGGVISRIYDSTIKTGGTGITLTLTANTGDQTIHALRIQSPFGVVIDNVAQALDASSPFGDNVSITPSAAGGVAVSGMQGGSNNTNPATHTVGSPWTIANQQAVGGANWVGGLAYNVFSSIAAQTASWTELGGASCATHMVTYLELGPPAPTAGVSRNDLVWAADWKPERWDWPLETDLLLDDYLPGAGAA